METNVCSTISTHITENQLSDCRQWAYKKGHSTELLLAKMTEDWRKALDKNQVVGIVFVDFRKAFDSISHSVLLQKLQGLGISGDLWSWIADYLSDRSQMTVLNGCQSQSMPVK
jgi:sarcosine oxidase/L-pipecolate oxidase